MRLQDSPEEARWRAEVREFLQKELPAGIRVRSRLVGGEGGANEEVKGKPEARAGGVGFRLEGGDTAVWRQKLADKGWIAPAWPREYGGAGLTTMEQFIMNEEFAEAGAPTVGGGMGVSMAGPTIIV